jgi:thiol-disulfide isomerase/thioredoxin
MKLIHYKILTITLTIFLVGLVVYLIQNTGLKAIRRIPAEEAASKALSYINENILEGRITATLIKVSEDKEKNLYKLNLKIGEQELESFISFDGKTLYPDAINLETEITKQEKVKGGETVDGDFIKLADQEICKENGKPIIYFFGSLSCPHCHWEYPIIKETVAKFGDKISFHDNMNEITDKEVFAKYSNGSVPTIVLGCRYYRVGSGEGIGKEKETEVLTNLIQLLINE